ncbi:MAG: transcription-repair coupling factor [Dehalococcoidales bacterium]|nr:transcription-repair coupling factor [Dehalococcoidales bacterium]
MQLDLERLLPLIEDMPAYREINGRIRRKKGEEIRALVLEAARPYLIAALYRHLKVPVLVVTSQPEDARRLFEQVSLWTGPGLPSTFPEPDTLPYQRSLGDFAIEQERLQVLASLSGEEGRKTAPLIICSAAALTQKTTAARDFSAACHYIETGMEIDPLELIKRWQSIGYQVDTMVETPGKISRRGGIVDLFPPLSEFPVRLEFFGNTLESMRLFDPSTQRSKKSVTRMAVCPAAEILPWENSPGIKERMSGLDLSSCSPENRDQLEQELAQMAEGHRPAGISFYSPLFNSDSLLDYLPPGTLVVLDEVSQVKNEIEYLDGRASDLREQKIRDGELPQNFPRPYFNWKELQAKIRPLTRLELISWFGSEEPGLHRLDFNPAPAYAGQLPALIAKTGSFLEQKMRLVLISNQAARLSELFEEKGISCQPVFEVKQAPSAGSITLVQGSMAEGWTMGTTFLLTDREIFGFIKERHLVKKRPVQRHKQLVDIKPGDYVVHVEHGIGRFSGIINMSTDTTRKEYLVLVYAAGDKLYVPTDQIDRVNRYVGAGEQEPALSRLGTQEWNRTREKVKEAVEEIAQDLLKLYASRQVVPGYAFSGDTVWQSELEASFPYIETADQIKVQEEVKEDMSDPRPMDRLVIGDVGYGKTEIAVRAAFKAVLDGKQVAVLVPTTVLAEQHYLTFKQRMGAFPVKIEVLSRFRTLKEQKRVIAGLADKSIDICIGTHRLLQKDVVFKDLGLLVIDEEQRFGVGHKEHLKKLREQVDVLTLSATPIPRTLHMSMVGVRDMSIIETPPENRLPIRTFVAEYNERLVREAILREIERRGQVFFVHNRVQGIAAIAARLKELVPEAVIDIAHGQMPEEQLERVMLNFQKGGSNLLVCTTIIESGLDLPNVNTLIVNRSDKFGLTQLYQLRGRIGRGANIAYAYFLYDRDRRLSPVAEQRLRTIFEATELGAGFGIAMKDLEIRGAGSLLGMKQSGNISAVGFNLYTQLLAEAVEEQKALRAGRPKETAAPRRPETTVDLPLKAYIPEDYVTDTDTRLSLYQRLTAMTSGEKVRDIAEEMRDRFGPLPPETENLLFVIRLRCLGAKAGIESISTFEGVVTMRLFPGKRVQRPKLFPFYRYGLKIGIAQVIIRLDRLGKDWQKLLEELVMAV